MRGIKNEVTNILHMQLFMYLKINTLEFIIELKIDFQNYLPTNHV